MAETARQSSQRTTSGRGASRTSTAKAEEAEADEEVGQDKGEQVHAGDVEDREPAGEGEREWTLNLPFMTTQFRAPHVHMPGRSEVDVAARGARSLLPSRKAALYYGALAATAALGVIEWPVAAAIGVGTALASRVGESPQQTGSATPEREESRERAAADA